MHESNGSTSLSGSVKAPAPLRTGTSLYLHGYRYFPYEKELARREILSVSGTSKIIEGPTSFQLRRHTDINRLQRLIYVAEVAAGKERLPTRQFQLENSYRKASGSGKRQATRYSVHGLHEYKGRFNPQVAGFLLNYFGATEESRIFDPFCGSGTTIVEAALRGSVGFGVDMNPLAVLICNAKLNALAIPAATIQKELDKVILNFEQHTRCRSKEAQYDSRREYLENWFPPETLRIMEILRECISETPKRTELILLALASDLIRHYSLQEPSDLRIRRRMSPLPSKPFLESFRAKADAFLRSLTAAQEVTGLVKRSSEAILGDSRELSRCLPTGSHDGEFDFVITSPPYATALPYIDTQRLSLVWLNLCEPKEIRILEAEAVGSRELNGQLENWNQRLAKNADSLPFKLADYCKTLKEALSETDGFRRKAVPASLYRYLADGKKVFGVLSKVLKRKARLGFVIGTNHTTLGGKRFDIDTPSLWKEVAEDAGFKTSEVLRLQTYQRYGLHQKNSINGESLVIFQKP